MRQTSALARLAARLCGWKADSVQEAPAIVNESGRCRFCGGPIVNDFCFVECSGAMRRAATIGSMRPRSYFGSQEYRNKRPSATRRPGSNPLPPTGGRKKRGYWDPPSVPPPAIRSSREKIPTKPAAPPNEIFREDDADPRSAKREPGLLEDLPTWLLRALRFHLWCRGSDLRPLSIKITAVEPPGDE